MPAALFRLIPGAVLCGLVLLVACDAVPGTSDDPRPPEFEVGSFSFAPDSVDLRLGADDYEVVDSLVQVPLELGVTARNEDNMERVRYVVQSPNQTTEPVTTGTLESDGSGRFSASPTVQIPLGASGVYTVLVYGVGPQGQQARQDLRGHLTFLAPSEPPVIERVEAPAEVERPAEGDSPRLLPLVAVISDPEGLANIDQVLFWNVERPDSKIPLFDDGQAAVTGDETAGDGRYTRIIQITSSNQPGTNTFAFQATDRSGRTSGVVEVDITVK